MSAPGDSRLLLSDTRCLAFRLASCIGVGLLAVVPVMGQEAPELTLSPADGSFPVAFTSVSSVRELPDGRVLLADRGERRLYLTNWDDGSATPIGRVGEGPREYWTIGWIYPLAGDSTLLTEDIQGRWHVLEGDRIVHTFRHDALLPSLFGGELGGGDGAGGLLGLTFHRGAAGGLDRYSADSLRVLLVPDLTDEARPGQVDTVGIVPGRGPGLPTSVRLVPGGAEVRTTPLVTETLAVLFPDGWAALAFAEPYHVRWRSPEGEWSIGDPLPYEPPSMTDAMRCAAVRGWDFRGDGGGCSQAELEAHDWPERAPPFLSQLSRTARGASASHAPSAFPAPDGRLLIRRLPPPDAVTAENRYDVVDRTGRLAGILRLPANEAIVGVGSDHLYVIATDAVDLQHLRRHRWPGG